MSTTTTKARKRTGPKSAQTKSGEQIPLVTAIPGGMAQWYAPGQLTPRRSREYELIAAEMSPLIERTVDARSVSIDGQGGQTFDGFTGPPVGLSRAELRAFLELTEAATWAYLKGWTLDRPLPADADSLQDLPRPLYEALTTHGSKLLAATRPGFDVTALDDVDDLDEADPDLPS